MVSWNRRESFYAPLKHDAYLGFGAASSHLRPAISFGPIRTAGEVPLQLNEPVGRRSKIVRGLRLAVRLPGPVTAGVELVDQEAVSELRILPVRVAQRADGVRVRLD